MVNIFISSTYIDCKEYRKAAKKAIEYFDNNELNVIGMELFGSRKETTLEVCLNEVKKADIYILIVAHRYGTIEKESKKSYTQLEYEEAVKKNIPILVYSLSDEVPVLPKNVDKNRTYNKLVKFKKVLSTNHTFSTFINDKELKNRIIKDISRELKLDYKANKNIDEKDISLRPELYNYEEYEIKFEICKPEINKLNPDIISNLKLTEGNTLFIDTYMYKDEINKRSINLIFHKHFTNWLIDKTNDGYETKIDDLSYENKIKIYKAKVRFLYTIYNDYDNDDFGRISYIKTEFFGYEIIEQPVFLKEYTEIISCNDFI